MPLDLNEMISTIQFRLGRRTDLAVEIENEIRLAQYRLEKSPVLEPWFLVSEQDLVTVIGDNTVALSADFIRESEEKQMQVVIDGVENPLERISQDRAASVYQDASGPPVAYTLSGLVLQVFPTPDKIYTIKHTVASHEPELTTTGTPVLTNGWIEEAYVVLLNKALIVLAQSLGNERVVKNATDDFSSAFAEFQTEIIQREESNQNYQRAKSSGDQLG